MTRFFRSVGCVLIGAALLLVLPLLNGKPSLFTDTRAYYILGNQLGEVIGLSDPGQGAKDLSGSEASSDSASRQKLALTVAASRSPYYSFYLFGLERAGGLWLVVAAQAVLASWVIFVFSAAASPLATRARFFAYCLVASIATTLPLYIGFMMPDFFTGVGVLAALCLLFYAERISVGNRVALVLLLGFSVLVHSTNVVVILVAAAVGFVVLWAQGVGARTRLVRSGGIALIALGGIVGSSAYAAAGRIVFGDELRSPPFIMARVVADGPGRAYLASACADNEQAYTLCRFKDRRLDDADVILWDKSDVGVFGSADYDTRVALIDEQMRFVVSTVLHDPVYFATEALDNIVAQIALSGVVDDVIFDSTAVAAQPQFEVFRRIIPGYEACAANPAVCAPWLSETVVGAVGTTALLLSMVVAVVCMVTWRADSFRGTDDRARAAGSFTVLLLVFLANAALCATLSGPHPRYQTRLTWLFPVAALSIWMARPSFSIERASSPLRSST